MIDLPLLNNWPVHIIVSSQIKEIELCRAISYLQEVIQGNHYPSTEMMRLGICPLNHGKPGAQEEYEAVQRKIARAIQLKRSLYTGTVLDVHA